MQLKDHDREKHSNHFSSLRSIVSRFKASGDILRISLWISVPLIGSFIL